MNRMIEALNGVAAAWWDWTVASTWQGALLLLAVGVILAAGRSLRPGLRYGLLLVVLLKFAVPPIFGVAYGFSDLLARAFNGVPAPALSMDAHVVVAAPSSPTTAMAVAAPTARLSPQAPALSPLALLLFLEAAGAGAILFLIARQWHVARQLLRHGTAGDEVLQERFQASARAMKLRRTPRLGLSDGAGAPQSGGILHPFVLLPSWAATMPAEELEILLAHELAHVRRRDALVNGFQAAAQALLWWNPAVWWLNRRIREEREFCCDDLVLARGIASGEAYSRTLVNVAERVSLPASSWAMAGMADNFGAIDRRVRRALAGGHARRGWGRYAALVALLLAAGWVLPGATDEEVKSGTDAPVSTEVEEDLVIAQEGTTGPEPENSVRGLDYQIMNLSAEKISTDHVKPGVTGPFGPRDHRMTVFEEVSLTLHSAQHAVDINIKAKRLEHTTGSDSDGLMVWEGDVEAQYAEFTAQAKRLEFISTFLFFDANLFLKDFGTVQAEQIRVDPVARRIDVLNGTVDEARLKEAFGENATNAPRGEWMTLPFAVVPQIVVDAWIVEVDGEADLGLPEGSVLTPDEADMLAFKNNDGIGELLPMPPVIVGQVSEAVLATCRAKIQALMNEGRAEVRSAPKIITPEGEEASISIGSEVPYNRKGETAFKFVGTQLHVLPTLVERESEGEDLQVVLTYYRCRETQPEGAAPSAHSFKSTAFVHTLTTDPDDRDIGCYLLLSGEGRSDLITIRTTVVQPGKLAKR